MNIKLLTLEPQSFYQTSIVTPNLILYTGTMKYEPFENDSRCPVLDKYIAMRYKLS